MALTEEQKKDFTEDKLDNIPGLNATERAEIEEAANNPYCTYEFLKNMVEQLSHNKEQGENELSDDKKKSLFESLKKTIENEKQNQESKNNNENPEKEPTIQDDKKPQLESQVAILKQYNTPKSPLVTYADLSVGGFKNLEILTILHGQSLKPKLSKENKIAAKKEFNYANSLLRESARSEEKAIQGQRKFEVQKLKIKTSASVKKVKYTEHYNDVATYGKAVGAVLTGAGKGLGGIIGEGLNGVVTGAGNVVSPISLITSISDAVGKTADATKTIADAKAKNTEYKMKQLDLIKQEIKSSSQISTLNVKDITGSNVNGSNVNGSLVINVLANKNKQPMQK